MTRIMVADGAGYIGSHVVEALIEEGFSPVIYDNLSTGHIESVPEGVPFVEGDIHDTALAERVMREHGIDGGRFAVSFGGDAFRRRK